jgi:peptidoglycan/xylan/chitin deacetylase (PgdA/CDA1 family)
MEHAQRPGRLGFRSAITLVVVATIAVAAVREGVFEDLARAGASTGTPRSASVVLGAEPDQRNLLAGLERRPEVVSAEQKALQRFASLGLPIFCGGAQKPFVALTFDDGPGPYTARTMSMLRAAGARATFFLVGRNLEYWPDLPARERELGAVGDHTWTHRAMAGAARSTMDEEIRHTRDVLAEATGGSVGLFRPPLGSRDAILSGYLRYQGLVQVLWSVDSRDSDGASPQEVLANVVAGLHPGAIVLMHENRGSTLSVLPDILAAVRAGGLQAVSVPYLLAYDPPTEDQIRAGGGCGPVVVASPTGAAV